MPERAEPQGAEAWLWRAAFWFAAVACVFPLFRIAYLPIQDLPQHLAAVRVLHDYREPAFGLFRYFELDLLRTQYLTIYLTTHALGYVLDIELAMRVVIAATLVGIPLSLRGALDALGHDRRYALLAFPLAYNAHLVLGFVNFLAAIALMFCMITLAARQRIAFSWLRAFGLSLVSIACFYTHVVPFALGCFAVCAIALGKDLRRMLRELVALLPCLVAAWAWLRTSAAGEVTLEAARAGPSGSFVYTPAKAALEQLPRWLTDVLAGPWDGRLLEAWIGVLLLAFAAAPFSRPSAGRRMPGGPGARLLVLPALCALLYFVAPTGYDFIWPIAQRFALLCALLSLLALPRLGARMSRVISGLALVLSLASFHHAGRAFGRFSREEVGDFEQALAKLPKGARVAGLIFDRHSRHVAFAPFIHFVAYYQARKGGAVMFSFADFPQSPFRFRADNRPPRVRPRWEWQPERVRLSPDLDWYDFVLVRGGRARMQRPRAGFVSVYAGSRWTVLARDPQSRISTRRPAP